MKEYTFRRVRELVHSRHVQRKVGVFVVEGKKALDTLLCSGMRPECLVSDEAEWLEGWLVDTPEHLLLSEREMERLSGLQSASHAVGVFRIPNHEVLPFEGGVSVLLDCVQDPGNVGSIVRTCAWFGVRQVVCSLDSAQVYSTKGVQASMGALGYMHVSYAHLESLIRSSCKREWLYVTDSKGTDVNSMSFGDTVVLVLGNEGHGIGEELYSLAGHGVGIAPVQQVGYDSLNVGAATAILCSVIAHQRVEKV